MHKSLVALLFALVLMSVTARAEAAACTQATPACSEWVTVSGGPSRVLVYRSHALDATNGAITRALVMVHGQGRTANNYFNSALAAAFLAGALEDTIVVAPRFASNEGRTCRDKLEAREANWVCSGPDSWRSGGAAVDNAAITSFHVADEILTRLARKDVFPNLRSIVVAGHSAGGQYTMRYSMANQIHERLGVRVAYVVANPSSYTYPDSQRPTRAALPSDVAASAPGYTPPMPQKPLAPYQAFDDAQGCTNYDHWPYGMRNRSGYSAKLSDEQLLKQLTARPVTFLVGELDILPLYGFDSSCAAMAQGPTRLARGLAYARYLREKFGTQHPSRVVPACGHSARCMVTANPVLPLLFPAE